MRSFIKLLVIWIKSAMCVNVRYMRYIFSYLKQSDTYGPKGYMQYLIMGYHRLGGST